LPVREFREPARFSSRVVASAAQVEPPTTGMDDLRHSWSVISIRRARAEDQFALQNLHARWIGDVFVGMYVPSDAERVLREQSWTGPIGTPHPRHSMLVAESRGQLVGFTAVGPTRDPDDDPRIVGELKIIIVNAAHRGAGIGSRLITAGEREMRDSGFSAATLWVIPENARAVRVYEHCGWNSDDTERLTNFAGREIRSLRYRKQLAP
jgi:GNAT superfamily N-acetyltransferase